MNATPPETPAFGPAAVAAAAALADGDLTERERRFLQGENELSQKELLILLKRTLDGAVKWAESHQKELYQIGSDQDRDEERERIEKLPEPFRSLFLQEWQRAESDLDFHIVKVGFYERKLRRVSGLIDERLRTMDEPGASP